MSDITVLVVDDEVRMRKLIKDFLMQKGYAILEAGDGEEALSVFEENSNKIICTIFSKSTATTFQSAKKCNTASFVVLSG